MDDTLAYKDVRVPRELLGVIDHMPQVEGYREELHDLGNQWDLLTILGQMSGTGTDMTHTREGFQRLTSELLGQLGLETLKKTVTEIAGKAQVAVDIVIRNLFERTADIGFLATDDDIREFLRAAVAERHLESDGPDASGAETRRQDRVDKIVTRFREYVAKYSVYHNIILLDKDGTVMAQLDADNDVTHSCDPLIREALATRAEYVEVFRHSDLLPAQETSLIYAYRITETNATGSPSLGVLCLCFRFENEMAGVFRNLSGRDDWSVITLLDFDGRVIASSDPYQIPVGSWQETVTAEAFKVTRFAGRRYLAKTCTTKGYQGFRGLGWLGHVMLPIDFAFDKGRAGGLKHDVGGEILSAVLADPRFFSDALRAIPKQAERIQRELERTVWNGNVRENNSQSKVLLWNISDAGARTKRVFEESIGNLHETVVSGILNDVAFHAALAVDIMDRNLYERANDCRWWALTSAFRTILSRPTVSDADANIISEILAYINGLYTVYSNLFVYDANGRILAVSNPEEAEIVGTVINERFIKETLALPHSQAYSVSAYEATPLYGGRHTYIYGAAITDAATGRHRVGGIGIVFDSAPQFREMLLDALPRNDGGDVGNGCFGVFVDRKGTIISTTEDRFHTGDILDIDRDFFALPSGSSASRIVAMGDTYYALGARTSSGYREYKTEDGYENDVIAMVFVPLAEATEVAAGPHRRTDAGLRIGNNRGGGRDCMEVATFYIGEKWIGVRAEHVLEAIGAEGLTSLPGAREFVVGKTLYDGKVVSVIDIRAQLGLPSVDFNPDSPIVVLDAGAIRVALVVDALGEIPEIPMDRVVAGAATMKGTDSYTECIVRPDNKTLRKDLLIVINPAQLVDALSEKRVPALVGR